ncbi:MAG: hypothetical protein HRT38_20815 [Alteromonadaceae bacterium]|nr:hypothetical protein [Alteromonadaceae bacterium]
MLEKIDLKLMINEFDLPAETKFIGYAIHLKNSDKFLYQHQIKKDYSVTKAWCTSPEQAEKFQSLEEVTKIRDELQTKARVVWMFDVNKQYIVTTPEEIE